MEGLEDQAHTVQGTNDHTSTVKGGIRLVTPEVVGRDDDGVKTSHDDQLVEGMDDQAPTAQGINDHASIFNGGIRLVTPEVVEYGEVGMKTSYDDQLVVGTDDQASAMRGMTDHASTAKGGLELVTPLVEDGWEGRSSDEDDFIKLTQHYVGGGLVHHDVPEIPIAVKTISAVEEDDRSASPTLDDDQDRLVTLQELLFSQRDEAGQNQPSLTSLSLIEGGDQSKGGPSQVEEVISTDTLRGSGLVSSMLGTPTQHHGDYEHRSSMENPHFVENRGSGSCTDTRGSRAQGILVLMP